VFIYYLSRLIEEEEQEEEKNNELMSLCDYDHKRCYRTKSIMHDFAHRSICSMSRKHDRAFVLMFSFVLRFVRAQVFDDVNNTFRAIRRTLCLRLGQTCQSRTPAK
jgi:hypothetical protein